MNTTIEAIELTDEIKQILIKGGNNFATLLRNKIHADALDVFYVPNGGTITVEKHSSAVVLNGAVCYWLPANNVALGVLIAPIRKVWYSKYKDELELPIWNDDLRLILFAHLESTGIPVPLPHIGLVNKTWIGSDKITIISLEDNGESKSKARIQSNLAQIAFGCYAASVADAIIHIEKK